MVIKALSTKHVIIRITVIIASAEFLIMLLLAIMPFEISKIAEAALDMALLVAVSTPAIYLWVVKPFVKARDEAVNQATHLAYTDPLTQLANRRYFLSTLEKATSNIARRNQYGAVMSIDLDGFKQVNDSYGHEAGDAVLVEIAKRFNSTVRSGDLVGRMGGDEFVILIDSLDADRQIAQDKTLFIADKLIDIAKMPIDFKGYKLSVGASIGVYILGLDSLNIDTVMNRADKAMYSAKKSGKVRSVFFD